MTPDQVRRAAGWLRRQAARHQASLFIAETDGVRGAVLSGRAGLVAREEYDALQARLARQRRAALQPRDWRGRWRVEADHG